MAMPTPPHSAQDADGTQNALVSWNYISAAAETVSDFKGFCDRKPQVCVTAHFLASTLEGKAKYSAKLVYEWASESSAEQSRKVKLPGNLAKVDQINTGSVAAEVASAAVGSSTLRIEDLIPDWHGTLQPEKG